MEEQGKFNVSGMNLPEEPKEKEAQTAKSPENPEQADIKPSVQPGIPQNGAYPNNANMQPNGFTPTNGVPQYAANPVYRYGYNNAAQGVPVQAAPLQGANYQPNMPYGGYPQAQNIPVYQPGTAAYPAQAAAPYTGTYPGQRGDGPGEYNYKQYTSQGVVTDAARGTAPGQYSYKQTMNQYSQKNTYAGPGPGQYDYRAAQQQYGYSGNYQPQGAVPEIGRAHV